MIFLPLIRKPLAGALALVYFTINVVLGHATETGFWAERRRAAERREEFFAAAPVLVRPGEAALPDLRACSAEGSGFSAPWPSAFQNTHGDIFRALPTEQGSVRKISLPPRGTGPLVIHIQDIHGNLPAQRRIAEAVAALAPRAAVVGLEGSSRKMDLSRFRVFSDTAAVALAAEELFLQGEITGPVRAALTARGSFPILLGLEDAALYNAHGAAYRQSRPGMATENRWLALEKEALDQIKNTVLSPALRAFHEGVIAHREGRGPLAQYLALITAGATEIPEDVRRFAQALGLEQTLNFQAVDKERRRAAEQLAGRMDAGELSRWAALGTAYRLGKIRYGAFYESLRELCRRHGVAVGPALDAYIRYALLADGVDSEKLFQGLGRLEKEAYDRWARTPEERAFVVRARRWVLENKLVSFSLTPEEWREYGALSERRASLAPFESFYTKADARDRVLAQNLLAALPKDDTAVAVLVTGGYHAPGITRFLNEGGAAVVSFVPKIEEIDTAAGAAALGVFAREKTPLQKLFEGEKLFLGKDPLPLEMESLALPAQVAAVSSGEATESLKQLLPLALWSKIKNIRSTSDGLTLRFKTWVYRIHRDLQQKPGQRLLATALPAVGLGYAGLAEASVQGTSFLQNLLDDFLPSIWMGTGWEAGALFFLFGTVAVFVFLRWVRPFVKKGLDRFPVSEMFDFGKIDEVDQRLIDSWHGLTLLSGHPFEGPLQKYVQRCIADVQRRVGAPLHSYADHSHVTVASFFGRKTEPLSDSELDTLQSALHSLAADSQEDLSGTIQFDRIKINPDGFIVLEGTLTGEVVSLREKLKETGARFYQADRIHTTVLHLPKSTVGGLSWLQILRLKWWVARENERLRIDPLVVSLREVNLIANASYDASAYLFKSESMDLSKEGRSFLSKMKFAIETLRNRLMENQTTKISAVKGTGSTDESGRGVIANRLEPGNSLSPPTVDAGDLPKPITMHSSQGGISEILHKRIDLLSRSNVVGDSGSMPLALFVAKIVHKETGMIDPNQTKIAVTGSYVYSQTFNDVDLVVFVSGGQGGRHFNSLHFPKILELDGQKIDLSVSIIGMEIEGHNARMQRIRWSALSQPLWGEMPLPVPEKAELFMAAEELWATSLANDKANPKKLVSRFMAVGQLLSNVQSSSVGQILSHSETKKSNVNWKKYDDAFKAVEGLPTEADRAFLSAWHSFSPEDRLRIFQERRVGISELAERAGRIIETLETAPNEISFSIKIKIEGLFQKLSCLAAAEGLLAENPSQREEALSLVKIFDYSGLLNSEIVYAGKSILQDLKKYLAKYPDPMETEKKGLRPFHGMFRFLEGLSWGGVLAGAFLWVDGGAVFGTDPFLLWLGVFGAVYVGAQALLNVSDGVWSLLGRWLAHHLYPERPEIDRDLLARAVAFLGAAEKQVDLLTSAALADKARVTGLGWPVGTFGLTTRDGTTTFLADWLFYEIPKGRSLGESNTGSRAPPFWNRWAWVLFPHIQALARRAVVERERERRSPARLRRQSFVIGLFRPFRGFLPIFNPAVRPSLDPKAMLQGIHPSPSGEGVPDYLIQSLSAEEQATLLQRIGQLNSVRVVDSEWSKEAGVPLQEYILGRVRDYLGLEALDLSQVEIRLMGSFLYSRTFSDIDFAVFVRGHPGLMKVILNREDAARIRWGEAGEQENIPFDIVLVDEQQVQPQLQGAKAGMFLQGLSLWGNLGMGTPSRVDRHWGMEGLFGLAEVYAQLKNEKVIPRLITALRFAAKGRDRKTRALIARLEERKGLDFLTVGLLLESMEKIRVLVGHSWKNLTADEKEEIRRKRQSLADEYRHFLSQSALFINIAFPKGTPTLSDPFGELSRVALHLEFLRTVEGELEKPPVLFLFLPQNFKYFLMTMAGLFFLWLGLIAAMVYQPRLYEESSLMSSAEGDFHRVQPLFLALAEVLNHFHGDSATFVDALRREAERAGVPKPLVDDVVVSFAQTQRGRGGFDGLRQSLQRLNDAYFIPHNVLLKTNGHFAIGLFRIVSVQKSPDGAALPAFFIQFVEGSEKFNPGEMPEIFHDSERIEIRLDRPMHTFLNPRPGDGSLWAPPPPASLDRKQSRPTVSLVRHPLSGERPFNLWERLWDGLGLGVLIVTGVGLGWDNGFLAEYSPLSVAVWFLVLSAGGGALLHLKDAAVTGVARWMSLRLYPEKGIVDAPLEREAKRFLQMAPEEPLLFSQIDMDKKAQSAAPWLRGGTYGLTSGDGQTTVLADWLFYQHPGEGPDINSASGRRSVPWGNRLLARFFPAIQSQARRAVLEREKERRSPSPLRRQDLVLTLLRPLRGFFRENRFNPFPAGAPFFLRTREARSRFDFPVPLFWRKTLSDQGVALLQQRLGLLREARVLFSDGTPSVPFRDFVFERVRENFGKAELSPKDIEIRLVGSYLYSTDFNDIDVWVFLKNSTLGSESLFKSGDPQDNRIELTPGTPPVPFEIWAMGDLSSSYEARRMRARAVLQGVRLWGEIGLPIPNRSETYLATEQLYVWIESLIDHEPAKALSYFISVAHLLVFLGEEGAAESLKNLEKMKIEKKTPPTREKLKAAQEELFHALATLWLGFTEEEQTVMARERKRGVEEWENLFHQALLEIQAEYQVDEMSPEQWATLSAHWDLYKILSPMASLKKMDRLLKSAGQGAGSRTGTPRALPDLSFHFGRGHPLFLTVFVSLLGLNAWLWSMVEIPKNFGPTVKAYETKGDVEFKNIQSFFRALVDLLDDFHGNRASKMSVLMEQARRSLWPSDVVEPLMRVLEKFDGQDIGLATYRRALQDLNEKVLLPKNYLVKTGAHSSVGLYRVVQKESLKDQSGGVIPVYFIQFLEGSDRFDPLGVPDVHRFGDRLEILLHRPVQAFTPPDHASGSWLSPHWAWKGIPLGRVYARFAAGAVESAGLIFGSAKGLALVFGSMDPLWGALFVSLGTAWGVWGVFRSFHGFFHREVLNSVVVRRLGGGTFAVGLLAGLPLLFPGGGDLVFLTALAGLTVFHYFQNWTWAPGAAEVPAAGDADKVLRVLRALPYDGSLGLAEADGGPVSELRRVGRGLADPSYRRSFVQALRGSRGLPTRNLWGRWLSGMLRGGVDDRAVPLQIVAREDLPVVRRSLERFQSLQTKEGDGLSLVLAGGTSDVVEALRGLVGARKNIFVVPLAVAPAGRLDPVALLTGVRSGGGVAGRVSWVVALSEHIDLRSEDLASLRDSPLERSLREALMRFLQHLPLRPVDLETLIDVAVLIQQNA